MEWYLGKFEEDLDSGIAEQWYETVTDAGIRRLEGSEFWQQLKECLRSWDAAFAADHGGYTLFGSTQQPEHIEKKSYRSVLNKSFRRNVLKNSNWPNPPNTILG